MKVLMCLAASVVFAGWACAQDTNNSNADKAKQKAGSSQTDNAKPAEMETKIFKGTLVDASCAHGASGSAADRTAAGDANTAATDSGKSKEKKAKSTAAGDQSQGCSVSSGTSQFALKMADGNTVTFDPVGNQRAQQAVKEKKKWTEAASGGKPIRATVSGVMQGDKLLVVTIG